MKKILLFTLFLLFAKPAFCYYEFDSKLKDSYSCILQFKLTEASTLLREEKAEKPGNDLTLLYENYIDFLKAFISEEKTDFVLLKKRTSERLSCVEKKGERNSPYYNYVQAEMMMQESLVKIKFHEFFSAVSLFVNANKLIQKNSVAYPTFILNEKLSGLINVVVGSIPPQYQWLNNLAGIRGSVKVGVDQLNAVYEGLNQNGLGVYKPELLFYRSVIQSAYNGPENNLCQLDSLFEKERFGGPLIAFSYSNILANLGENDKVIAVINSGIISGRYSFPFLIYKRGVAYLRKGMFDFAQSDFEFFLRNFHGQNYIKAGYQKLAWISILKNDTAAYFKYLDVCSENGSVFSDEDKEAQSEAMGKQVPNTRFLSARLFFDGGYYSESLKSLLSFPVAELGDGNEKLEYAYRMGRIMEKTGRIDKAELCYQSVYEAGKNASSYFASNSCLLLGRVFEKRGEVQRAIQYYKLVLLMKDHQYKNSIDQKAKAALQRLE